MPKHTSHAFFSALVQSIRWIALAAVLLAALFAGGAKLFVRETYQSAFQLYISPYSESKTTAVVSGGAVSPRELAKECTALMQNDRLLEAVASALQKQGYTMTKSAVRRAVRITAVDGTALLDLAAVTEDPQLSRAICTAYSETAPEQLRQILHGGTITVMTSPGTGEQVGPVLWLAALYGAAAGLLLSFAAVVLLYHRHNRVTDSDGIRCRLGLPVLGEIPGYTPGEKGGTNP